MKNARVGGCWKLHLQWPCYRAILRFHVIVTVVPLLVVTLFLAEFSLGGKYLRVTVQPLNPFPNHLSAYCLTLVTRVIM